MFYFIGGPWDTKPVANEDLERIGENLFTSTLDLYERDANGNFVWLRKVVANDAG